ncbi:5-(carboxyamino)imidazole ribonucleotide synthase [Companilactobacillus mishanensis]|uniref:N5-carboxyaminoimidazole ribonucleotide synthase n=1 Tax=Companilactobacillus mishanensis TaxID=2486008 RepID=A0A5P0ZEM4_9LACO|nr:5-(carboxyamino)imidazole ribonucleotide synthase [Companilactobacillus mishanensis]MQS51494.1 5-(carboxyamino)imidazole ribonucleotide synthase [Companilactobacillus mishanensis]
MNKVHLPGETIGIIGGGQLGQMMAASAKEKGFKVIILDPTENCPAAQVSDKQIVAEYDDLTSLITLARECDVLTYEFKNVDAETINEIKKYTDVPQGTKALLVTQNRIREKEFISENHFPVVPHAIVNSVEDFDIAISKLQYPVILKTVEGGYDGKGQLRIDDEGYDKDEVEELISKGTCILESRISLSKEVSVVISSNSDHEHSVFPLIENEHHNNILHISNCPARVGTSISVETYEIARSIANKLDLVGTMCIEFFIDTKNKVYVNEIAPRPHNSGHLTIEACNISQFDAHILGVCDWKMPEVKLFEPAIMVNLLGQHLEPAKNQITDHEDWNFHDYGKSDSKYNRKMGHITILTEDVDSSIQQIKENPIWND